MERKPDIEDIIAGRARNSVTPQLWGAAMIAYALLRVAEALGARHEPASEDKKEDR